MKLSKQDVDRLLKDPSVGVRHDILVKIAGQYNAVSGEDKLTPEEDEIVEVIFRTLAKNAEIEIRKTLAEILKDSPKLPRDVAQVLTKDLTEISTPILQYSPALADEDLLEIIKNTRNMERVYAIARRENLSETITTALLDKKDETLHNVVLRSFGSKISELSYEKILSNAKVSEKVVNAMIEKGSLPVAITEKLLMRMGDKARETLDEKYHVVFESKKVKQQLDKSKELAAQHIAELRAAVGMDKKTDHNS